MVELLARKQIMGKQARPTHTEVAELLKVLGDPTRLLVLERLMEGVQCNCQIGDDLGLPTNLISHHLRVLRQAGLVEAERDPLDRRWVYYSVNRQALASLRDLLCAFFDPARVQDRLPTCGPQTGPEGETPA